MKFTGLMLRLTVAYLIVFAGVAILQDRFIYFPEKAATGDVVSSVLRAWPTPEAFRGLVAEPVGSVRATVIVFHGNAGHAGHRSNPVESQHRFRHLGRCLETETPDKVATFRL
jgi:hypothetical protein